MVALGLFHRNVAGQVHHNVTSYIPLFKDDQKCASAYLQVRTMQIWLNIFICIFLICKVFNYKTVQLVTVIKRNKEKCIKQKAELAL